MVTAVHRGASLREVAQHFGVAAATVWRWVQRAAQQRLDRVEWTDRPSRPRHTRRTAAALEDGVLSLRRDLRHSDLGQFGALAIRQALEARGLETIPCVRTIGRILERRGALDAYRRIRRPPPPRGWYLPEVAAQRAELDSFDTIEGLVIQGGQPVEVLNVISLHGGLVGSYPVGVVSAKIVVEMLLDHWRQFGLPTYAQFDNDTRFQGAHQFADTVGRVARLCLRLGVVPVFTPPRETGFQALIENYNGWWQAKVWARFHQPSLATLQERSARYVAASRRSRAARIEAAPHRRPFPPAWSLDLQERPRGRLLYLRRSDEESHVSLLGHRFGLGAPWPSRLVRAEVDLVDGHIAFYALRRREPHQQPLLGMVPYQLPDRAFKG